MSLTIPEFREFLSVNRDICDFSSLNQYLHSLFPDGLDPVIFPSIRKPALYAGNFLFKVDFPLTPKNLQVGDVVKLLRDNNTYVFKVTSLSTSPEYTFTVETNGDENLEEETYELYGIELYDVDRIGYHNYMNLKSDPNVVITQQSVASLNFNPELYKILYPESRLMNDQDAFIQYMRHSRIGNVQELLSSDTLFTQPIRLPSDVTFDNIVVEDSLHLGGNKLDIITGEGTGLLTEQAIQLLVSDTADDLRDEIVNAQNSYSLSFSNIFSVPDGTLMSASKIEVRDELSVPATFWSNITLPQITLPSFKSILFNEPGPISIERDIEILGDVNFPNMSNIQIDKDVYLSSNLHLTRGIDMSRVNEQIMDASKTVFYNQVIFDTSNIIFKPSRLTLDHLTVNQSIQLPSNVLKNSFSNMLFDPNTTSLFTNKLFTQIASHSNWNFEHDVRINADLYCRDLFTQSINTPGDTPLAFVPQVRFYDQPLFPNGFLGPLEKILTKDIDVKGRLHLLNDSWLTLEELCSFRIKCRAYFEAPPEFKTPVTFDQPVTFASSPEFLEGNLVLPNNLVLNSPSNIVFLNPPQEPEPPDLNDPHTFSNEAYFSKRVYFEQGVEGIVFPVPEPDLNPVFESVTLKNLHIDSNVDTIDLQSINLKVKDLNASEKVSVNTLAVNDEATINEATLDKAVVNELTVSNKINGLDAFLPDTYASFEVTDKLTVKGDAFFEGPVTLLENPLLSKPLDVSQGIIFPSEVDFTNTICTFGDWESKYSTWNFPDSIEKVNINKPLCIDTPDVTFNHPLHLDSLHIAQSGLNITWDDKIHTPLNTPIVLEGPLEGYCNVSCDTLLVRDNLTLGPGVVLSADQVSFTSVDLPPLQNVSIDSLLVKDITVTEQVNDLSISNLVTENHTSKKIVSENVSASNLVTNEIDVVELDANKIRVQNLTINSNVNFPSPFNIKVPVNAQDAYFSNISISQQALFSNAHFNESVHVKASVYDLNASNLHVDDSYLSNLKVINAKVNNAQVLNLNSSNLNTKTLFADISRVDKEYVNDMEVEEANIKRLHSAFAAFDKVDIKSNVSQTLSSKVLNIEDVATIATLSNNEIHVSSNAYVSGTMYTSNMVAHSNEVENLTSSSVNIQSNLQVSAPSTFSNQVSLQGELVADAPVTLNNKTTFNGEETVFQGTSTKFSSNVDFKGQSVSLDEGNVSITGPNNTLANVSMTSSSFSGPNIRFNSTPTFDSNIRVHGKSIMSMIVIGRPKGAPIHNVPPRQQTNVNMSHVVYLNDSSMTKVFSSEEPDAQFDLEVALYPNAVIQTNANQNWRIRINLIGMPFPLGMLGTRGEITLQEKSMYGRSLDLGPQYSFQSSKAPPKTGGYALNTIKYVIVEPNAVSAVIENIGQFSTSEQSVYKEVLEIKESGTKITSLLTWSIYTMDRGAYDGPVQLPNGELSTSFLERGFLVTDYDDVRRLLILNDASSSLTNTNCEIYEDKWWSCTLPGPPAVLKIMRGQEVLTTIESPYPCRLIAKDLSPILFINTSGENAISRISSVYSASNQNSEIIYVEEGVLKITNLNNMTTNVVKNDVLRRPYPRLPIAYIANEYKKIYISSAFMEVVDGFFTAIGGLEKLVNNNDLIIGINTSGNGPVMIYDGQGKLNFKEVDGGMSVVKYSGNDLIAQWTISSSGVKGLAPQLVPLEDGDFLALWETTYNSSIKLKDAWDKERIFEGNMVMARHDGLGNLIYGIEFSGVRGGILSKTSLSFEVIGSNDSAFIKDEKGNITNLLENKHMIIRFHLNN